MITLTTNRFLSKVLRTLCCVGALTACSAWATVVPWQLNPIGVNGTIGATKDLSQSEYTATARGFDNAPSIDASHQYSFKSAPESERAGETSSELADALNNKSQASDADTQQVLPSALSHDSGQSSTGSTQSDDSLLFAASNTPTRAATELEDAMTSAFDEEFVSVPTVQFASIATAPTNFSGASGNAVTVDPVPEMSALFPIVGLIAAVSCTQILRRRRAAQLSASRRLA